MNTNRKTWLSGKQLILSLIGFLVLVYAWWAFRPEKLFINQSVNEAAPFASASEPRPIFTGRLDRKIHPTSGRATIYKTADGSRYLRLTDFTTSNGPDVHVVLLRAEDKQLEQELVKGELDHVDLGTLKGNQGDQNYDLPAATDLNQYQTVAIYCERSHALFGLAKLEEF
jgi:hypothetical protein